MKNSRESNIFLPTFAELEVIKKIKKNEEIDLKNPIYKNALEGCLIKGFVVKNFDGEYSVK